MNICQDKTVNYSLSKYIGAGKVHKKRQNSSEEKMDGGTPADLCLPNPMDTQINYRNFNL